MKVLVFIDHDVICRNFIMSAALAPLAAAAEVKFIFPERGHKRMKVDPATLSLGAPFEHVAIDNSRVQYWRWALFADQLRLRPGRAERGIRRIRRLTLGGKATILLTVAGLPGVYSLFRRWLDRKIAARPNAALTALIDRERPDIVLHPSVLEGLFINDLALECGHRNIPLIVAMNSWDNPSTKRAVVGQLDWLLVWGPQTRDHALRFMSIAGERVVPFGAAQFDVFRLPPRESRDEFSAAHGIDPKKRIVLFAGSNAQTDEFSTLQQLDRLIESGALPGTEIVYRPHPWGQGGRGGARLAAADWKHIRLHAPTRDYIVRLAKGDRQATLPDYRDTHDLLSVVDVVISPLSTILLEAALHGKPAIIYAPKGADGSEVMAVNLPMLHFEDFIRTPGIGYAETVDELAAVLAPLGNPEIAQKVGAQLKQAAERFVTFFSRPWRERLVDFVTSVAGAERPAVHQERKSA